MKRTNGWLDIGVVVVALAGTVALASAAHAIVQSTIVATSPAQGGGNPIIFGAVNCPEGASAVGGGVEVNSPFFVTATANYPTFGGFGLFSRSDGVHGAPDGWNTVAVMDLAQQLGSTLKTAVLCSTTVTPQTVIASTSIPLGGTGSATAECPDGAVALSGGVELEAGVMRVLAFEPTFEAGALSTLPLGAGPAPSGWTATARNDDSGVYGLKVAAICSSTVAAATDVTTFAVSGSSNDIGSGVRACPADGIATAGGFGAPSPTALAFVANAPTLLPGAPNGVNPAPTSWSAVVRSNPNSFIATFAVVCVPEPSPTCAGLAALGAVVATRIRVAHRSG